MSENSPQDTLDGPSAEDTTEADRATARPAPPEPFDAPKDVDERFATGYAVYDRTLGRYVGGVTKDKPSKPREAVAEGHAYKVVRV